MNIKLKIDLDGVIVNLFKKFEELHGEKIIWVPGAKNFEHVVGIQETKRVWKEIQNLGEFFWTELQPYDGAMAFIKECISRVGKNNIVFLTAPTDHTSSIFGKVEWMKKFMGSPKFDRYIITKHKYECAGRESVLIDDMEKKIDGFREHGGMGILFPRPWNRAANNESTDSWSNYDYILRHIDKILDGNYETPDVQPVYKQVE